MSIELNGSNLILCIYFIWFVIYFCFFCLWVRACVHVTWCDNSTLWCVAISRICNVYAMRKSTVNWQQRILCQKEKKYARFCRIFLFKVWMTRKMPHYLHFLSQDKSPSKNGTSSSVHTFQASMWNKQTKTEKRAQKTRHSMPHWRILKPCTIFFVKHKTIATLIVRQ